MAFPWQRSVLNIDLTVEALEEIDDEQRYHALPTNMYTMKVLVIGTSWLRACNIMLYSTSSLCLVYSYRGWLPPWFDGHRFFGPLTAYDQPPVPKLFNIGAWAIHVRIDDLAISTSEEVWRGKGVVWSRGWIRWLYKLQPDGWWLGFRCRVRIQTTVYRRRGHQRRKRLDGGHSNEDTKLEILIASCSWLSHDEDSHQRRGGWWGGVDEWIYRGLGVNFCCLLSNLLDAFVSESIQPMNPWDAPWCPAHGEPCFALVISIVLSEAPTEDGRAVKYTNPSISREVVCASMAELAFISNNIIIYMLHLYLPCCPWSSAIA